MSTVFKLIINHSLRIMLTTLVSCSRLETTARDDEHYRPTLYVSTYTEAERSAVPVILRRTLKSSTMLLRHGRVDIVNHDEPMYIQILEMNVFVSNARPTSTCSETKYLI